MLVFQDFFQLEFLRLGNSHKQHFDSADVQVHQLAWLVGVVVTFHVKLSNTLPSSIILYVWNLVLGVQMCHKMQWDLNSSLIPAQPAPPSVPLVFVATPRFESL